MPRLSGSSACLAMACALLLPAAATARPQPPSPPVPARVAALVRQLDDDDFDKRRAAAAALAQIGEAAQAPLARAAAEHADLEVRKRARQVLGRIFAVRVNRLIDQLSDPTAPFAQAELVKLCDAPLLRPDALETEVLAEVARDGLTRAATRHPLPRVRQAARRALSLTLEVRIDRLIKQLGDDSYAQRQAGEQDLVKIGTPALGQLRRARRSDPDPEVRLRAFLAIKAIQEGM